MQLQNLKNLIQNIENEDKYKNLETKVEDMVMKIINDKSINLPLILIAVLEALEMTHQNTKLFLIIQMHSKMIMLMVKIYSQRKIMYSLTI